MTRRPRACWVCLTLTAGSLVELVDAPKSCLEWWQLYSAQRPKSKSGNPLKTCCRMGFLTKSTPGWNPLMAVANLNILQRYDIVTTASIETGVRSRAYGLLLCENCFPRCSWFIVNWRSERRTDMTFGRHLMALVKWQQQHMSSFTNQSLLSWPKRISTAAVGTG